MQCTLAEKLIPLFVSDDLPDEQMRTLRAHLDGCATCRQLTAEFSESQNWLRTLAAPALDEAIFDGLRAGLAQEIAAREQRPPWFAPRRNPRFAFAATAAVILSIAAFGIYAFRHQSVPQDKLTLRPDNPDQRDDHPPQVDRRDQPISPKRVVRHGEPKRLALRQSDLSVSSRSLRLPVLPPIPVSPEPRDVALTDATRDLEMLRIEMQTADPNIRIIWFVPKVDASTPNGTNTK